jgi:hypothetical protein
LLPFVHKGSDVCEVPAERFVKLAVSMKQKESVTRISDIKAGDNEKFFV